MLSATNPTLSFCIEAISRAPLRALEDSVLKLVVRVARCTFIALLSLVIAPSFASVAAETSSVIAFVDVNVVPMDTDQVLRHRTVLVRNGRIEAIGASLSVPKDARIVDGHGRAYLSPGLADMHTHSDTAADMKVYLANGVTSVLQMGEASNEFIARIKPAINAGKKPGPHVYAAFLVDGSPRYGHFTVTRAEEARWLVRLAKTNGYEFIKVYNNLAPETFAALIEEGRAQGLPVIGHGVTRVGLERQLDAGQLMVAHTEEFLYTFFTRPDEPASDAAPDPQRIPAAIALIQRDHAFVTADIHTYATIARQWGRPDAVADLLRRPEVRYVSPDRRIDWRGDNYAQRAGSIDAKLAFLQRFTKTMSDADVALVAGTDAPTIPGLVPGFSLHDDLHALEQAGLSRYRVLAAATRAPGEMIRRAIPSGDAFGTVARGNRADLLLLEANPLDDLATLRQPLGVMANGKWYSRADLQALLDGVADEYARAAAP